MRKIVEADEDEDEDAIANAIVTVAKYLPQADVDELLEMVMDFEDSAARFCALDALVTRNSPQATRAFLEQLICSRDMRKRAMLLMVVPLLVKHIDTSQLSLIRDVISDAAAWFP